MDNKRFPKIASNSSQNHQRLRREWHKDAKSWINHWAIKEDAILHNTNNIKNIFISKFKENMWCDKELEDKRKLRYYKEVVYTNLEDQKYLLVLISTRKKINIAKIQTNYHNLHSKLGTK
jgi:hypothetical protein